MKVALSQTIFCGGAHIHGKIGGRLHADLDSNGLIDQTEFSVARFAAALDRNDPSLLFGPPRQLRLGIGLSF